MKEYGIYIRQGNWEPYMIHIFNNIESAKGKLFEMIILEEERGRPYFVDNDFFDNQFHIASKLKYYCIKEREVSEWTKFSETNLTREKNNKIIYFQNYKLLQNK